MTISELIKELETIRAEKGDLRVTVYDEYTANEGYGYDESDLYLDVAPCVQEITEDEKVVETVVLL